MTDIEINEDFKKALDLAECLNKNLFITGRAGTGKSTLLKYFREHTQKKIAVIAPTGVAAVNIGGQTVHSFFGFRPDITVNKVERDYKKVRKAKLYAQLDALVIDEISMVRADLLDCVNAFLKMHGRVKGKPFGGIQMIFFGDLYQLPPVVTSSEKEIFEDVYKSPYFFNANVMNEITLEIVELNKIYRQKDGTFIDILNSVRNKSIADNLLDVLNSRLDPLFEIPDNDFYIYLTTTNAKADLINNERLNKLKTPEFQFDANITGKFDEKCAPAPISLYLKAGAHIMLVNNDKKGRYINGTVGKLIKINQKEDTLTVQLSSGKKIEVYPYTWEMYRFQYNEKDKRIESETVGSFTQFPIILAWAITIHKSQGKTFEKAIIDMDKGAFTHGQTYVALSRCVSLEGLVLKKPIEERHIMVDWRVSKFLTEYTYKKVNAVFSIESKTKIIESAIRDDKKITITYLKANDTKTQRVVKPFETGEMFYKDIPFLGFRGFDELMGEERVFKTERVLEIKIV